MAELKIGGIYKHYKNKNYKVIGLAHHSETLEEFIVYECLYPNEMGQLWVRPKELFFDEVEVNGVKVPHFELIG